MRYPFVDREGFHPCGCPRCGTEESTRRLARGVVIGMPISLLMWAGIGYAVWRFWPW